MTLEDFTEHVSRFAQSDDLTSTGLLLNFSLGLGGESGEVLDIIKKHVFHGKEYDRTKISLELGDVLWYLVALCQQLEIPLEEIMSANQQKLEARHEGQKFNREISNRNKEKGL